MVTTPSFHCAPRRSPVMLSGESTSEASLPASSRIASTRSAVTSSHPGSVFTWSSPTTYLSTNCISFRGATYSATRFSSDLRRQFRDDLEQVSHQPVIRDLEDRGLGILVDRDAHLAVLHAREVLDRAGDPDRHVELRGHDLARLPHLVVVGAIAGVDGGARGAERGTQLVGERLQHLEVLAAREPAAAGDHAPRAAHLRARRFREL